MSNMSDYGIRHQREKLFDDFELMWRSGDRPDLEAFVRSNLGAENEKVLRELICIDLDYRLQGNEVPRFE